MKDRGLAVRAVVVLSLATGAWSTDESVCFNCPCQIPSGLYYYEVSSCPQEAEALNELCEDKLDAYYPETSNYCSTGAEQCATGPYGNELTCWVGELD